MGRAQLAESRSKSEHFDAAIAVLIQTRGLKAGAAWAMIDAANRDTGRSASQVSVGYIAHGHFA